MGSRRLSHPHYRRDIDGLRAVAILSVVAFHAFPEWVRGGFVGVDIFFVISGYLISSIIYTSLQQNTFRFSEFYARRVCRIFPALLVMLTTCLIAGWIILLPREYKELGKHIVGAATFSSNLILWREAGYFDAASISKPLLHLWSLGIEEQFYLLFPLFVYLSFRKRFLALPFLLGLTALSFFMAVIHGATDPVGTFYSPLARFWELLGGSLLAYSSVNAHTNDNDKTLPWVRDLSSIIGLAGIACAMLSSYDESVFPLWQCLFAVIGAILLIHAGPLAAVNRIILSNRFMVAIGIISYPLYLWHWPILSYLHMFTITPPTELLRIAAIFAGMVLAWLTYYFIEKPLSFGPPSRIKVAMLCQLMLVTGVAGYTIHYQSGFPSRFPSIISYITVPHYSFTDKWGPRGCFRNNSRLENASTFPPECIDVSKKISLVLWGDSRAAMLYYGLKRLGEKYPLSTSEFTAELCPPFLNYEFQERPYCETLNNVIVREISFIKPDYVILNARWDYHYDFSKLKNTIAVLKKLKIAHITIMGPSPLWVDSLPNLLFRYWKLNPKHSMPPQYMRFGIDPRLPFLDQKMQKIAKDLGVDYISIYHKLCNKNGCLTRVSDEPGSIANFDEQHLTPQASEYLINAIAGYFSAPPPAAAH